MTTGTFIVLEGIDGSGTTSQTRRLGEVLRTRGHTVFETHQPSKRSIGVQIRSLLQADGPKPDPRTLALLFAADRLDHVAAEIQPALARGEIVLCDRYVVSSWAYQAMECPADWVRSINRHALWPDLTLLLEVPAQVGLARVRARTAPENLELYETAKVQQQVCTNYADIAAEGPPGFLSLDGTLPMETITTMLADLCIASGL